MRITVVLIMLAAMVGMVQADFLGLKKASEFVVFPVHPPLDSAGIPGPPDSIQVISYADNGSSKVYSASGGAYSCVGIDTTRDYGGTHIWFADQIQDIDGAGGNVELAVQVITWYKKLPTYSFATIQVLTDSLNMLASINDSLEHFDNWVSAFKPATDSVMAKANLVQVSDDATAANNLELAWEGSNDHSVTLSLKSVNVQNSAGSAIVAASTGGNGHGMSLSGIGTGKDLNADFADSINATVASRSTFSAAADSVSAKANVSQISGDAAAADNLETMLDGAGGKVLSLRQLRIIGTAGNDTAIIAQGTGAGVGLYAKGGAADIKGNIAGAIDSLGGGGVDAVWNEAQSGHIVSGTFGRYLDAAVSTIGSPSGSGTYPVTLVAVDSSDGRIIPGAAVTVLNLACDAVLATGATASNGRASFNLDTGQFILSATAPGYIFGAFDTVHVVGITTDSLRGYHFDPGQPASGDLCRVYGFIYGIDGRPLEGVVVAAELLEGTARHDGVIISPYRLTARSDSTGYFYLDLIPSEGLAPTDAKYLLSATYAAGTIWKRKIVVPTAPSWQLSW